MTQKVNPKKLTAPRSNHLRSGKVRFIKAASVAGAALSSFLFIGASATQPNSRALVEGETGRVSEVVDGDTVFLDSGLKVRLSAMQAPKLPLGRPGFKAWPLGEAAKSTLEDMVLGQTVSLRYGGQERDRYGRALAQMFIKNQDDLWVQEAMIRAGFARVYTWPDTWQDSTILYAAERDARKNRRGIWDDPYYAVRTPAPNALAQDVDSFQIVQGIIISTADVRGRIYLNFGSDYKTDFTVAIDKQHRKRFDATGIDPLSLEGATVRVRGWVELGNGPVIWMDHPERLEILN